MRGTSGKKWRPRGGRDRDARTVPGLYSPTIPGRCERNRDLAARRSLIGARRPVGNGVRSDLARFSGAHRREASMLQCQRERRTGSVCARMRDPISDGIERGIGANQQDIGRRCQQRNREPSEGSPPPPPPPPPPPRNLGVRNGLVGVTDATTIRGIPSGAAAASAATRPRRRAPAGSTTDRLAPMRETTSQRAGEDVHAAAGRIRHDNMHRFGGHSDAQTQHPPAAHLAAAAAAIRNPCPWSFRILLYVLSHVRLPMARRQARPR